MREGVFIGFAALTVLSCGPAMPRTSRAAAVSVRVEVTPVPLDPRNPSERRIGSFVYAGGIEIRSPGSATIFELSDLRIVSGDHLVAVSDRGNFFEARLLFDETERLSGLVDARVIPLVGERGELLTGTDADAEGLELLPDGDRLVSFERNHRIWRYPADGGAPRPAPEPDAAFPANEGMEAITLYPAAGPDAYLVGSEGGTIWLCGRSATCKETAFGAHVPTGLGLTALSAYGEDGGFAMLSRAYDPQHGVRISVRLIETIGAPEGRVVDEMTMAAPLTVDNFEGIAVVPRATGGIRLYLVSDDNGSATQRTYLLAFDWQRADEKRAQR
jgi:hypothetical protein